MTSQPLVTIVTPAYNQAAWLPDCLLSVTNQTYKQIEHIVVDDGSTDETPLILERAAGFVRWIHQENAGQSAAINRALGNARGEIVGWLNSDDAFFDVRAVERAVATFEKYPQVDVVYGHAAVVNAEGLVLHLLWAPPFNAKLLRFTNFIVQPAAFVRRSAVGDHIVSEDYAYSMDRDLWLRLLPGHNFKRVRAIIGIDRHHSSRKGIARPDLVASDHARLIVDHGLHGELRYQRLSKMLTILRRFVGVALLPESMRVRLAFAGARDSAVNLLWRQVAVPRHAMPAGLPEGARTTGAGKARS